MANSFDELDNLKDQTAADYQDRINNDNMQDDEVDEMRDDQANSLQENS